MKICSSCGKRMEAEGYKWVCSECGDITEMTRFEKGLEKADRNEL